MLLEIIDLYASEYGWTSVYILENVYVDEFFIQRDIIDQRKRDNYKIMAHISLLPNQKEEAIQGFFDMLDGNNQQPTSLMDKEIETDFEAILKAKEEFEKYSKMT